MKKLTQVKPMWTSRSQVAAHERVRGQLIEKYNSDSLNNGSLSQGNSPSKSPLVAHYDGPRVCVSGVKQYPLTFSSFTGNYLPYLLPKVWDFMPIHPNYRNPKITTKQGTNATTVSFPYLLGQDDEDIYRGLAAMSYFAFTHRRGGWDCSRNYELASTGTVLYMPEIDVLPRYVMSNYDRRLLQQVVMMDGLRHVGKVEGLKTNPIRYKLSNGDFMYDSSSQSSWRLQFSRPGTIMWNQGFNISLYWMIAKRLFRHAKRHFNSVGVVSYLLKVTLEVEADSSHKSVTGDGAIGYPSALSTSATSTGSYPNVSTYKSTPIGELHQLDFLRNVKHVLVISKGSYDYMEMSILAGLDELNISVTRSVNLTEGVFLSEPSLVRREKNEKCTDIDVSGDLGGRSCRNDYYGFDERELAKERSNRLKQVGYVNGFGFGYLMRYRNKFRVDLNYELLHNKTYDAIIAVTIIKPERAKYLAQFAPVAVVDPRDSPRDPARYSLKLGKRKRVKFFSRELWRNSCRK
eukprot:Tbor_TRINITY_DN5828_c0_g1::TRINITY_DN5828_c0_g1_i3::g.7296::m.7296